MLKSLKALSPPYTYIIDNDEPMNPGNGYALSKFSCCIRKPFYNVVFEICLNC